MMGSSSVTFVGISDAPTLEALRAAKQWHWQMIDLHLTRILASSDCQTVIKDLETIGGGGGGRHVAIIKEIKARASEFEACNFIYESTRRNFETDNLAKLSLSLDVGLHVWLLQPHDIVTIPTILVNQ